MKHNFETAHRLPHLGGKCENLHGHSWWAEVTVSAPELDAQGIVVEFGAFKRVLRRWMDDFLDHGAMLGSADPLLPCLKEQGCKVYEFEQWPTVEAVAELIATQAQVFLESVDHAPGARISRVVVRETAVNAATWGEQ